ncbi:protein of unknown function [Dethiosulfatibacter aminovorans DSM 17477]|uniref:DUF3870 domain-containing protein n=1 Tax=Dethiosulfatibacter aminovorans DSM 17477 TaxID=1121476 RepID=A0A1M6CBH6_9FIRM|nr:DUF3870 domain-containing protein [Dethiosulfatibacter aminovorans]SHI58171.1 protein of unknown function [Dethiosulfatibacter aminovorans DSM 17477]
MIDNIADEIIVTGYAKLPSNITARKLYEVIAVALLVKTQTGEIIEADCTLSTNLAKKFTNDMLKGKCLSDIDDIEYTIDTAYFGSAKKAIKTAVQNCKKRFDSLMDDED